MTIRPISTVLCECTNAWCPHGLSPCPWRATDLVYSAHAPEGDGVAMCDDCADEAIASGRYTEDVA